MTSSEEISTEKKRSIRSDLISIILPWLQEPLFTEADHQFVEDLHSEMKLLRSFMSKDQDHHMPVMLTNILLFMKSSQSIILSRDHHNILLEETSHQQEKRTWDKVHTTNNMFKTDKEVHLDRAAQEETDERCDETMNL